MARISGKNGKIRGVLARTTVSVDTAMTNSGDNQTYSYQSYWNPNLPPTIKKNGVVQARTAYTVDYISGEITFAVANLVTDVIEVNDIEYMTMQDVGDLFNWTLDAKVEVVDATGFQDAFAHRLSGIRGWTASAEGYHVSGYWWSAFEDAQPFYVELFPDAATTEKFVGAAFVDYGTQVKMDAPVTEKMMLNGTGEIRRAT